MTTAYKLIKWYHVALLMCFVLFVAVLTANKASAWSLNKGYFTHSTDFKEYNNCSDGNTWVHHVVICGGLRDSDSKDVFIARISDRLNNGSVSDKVGASAIVYLMLGYSDGVGKDVPVSTDGSAYKDWEDRVKNSAVQLSVENYYYELNSALVSMDPDGEEYDLVFYKPGSGTFPALVFKVDGKEVFAIKLKCANPVGDSLKELPPAEPPDHLPTFKLNASCDRIRITNLRDQDRPGGKVWVEIYPKTLVTNWNVQFNGTREIAIKDLSQVLAKQTISVVAFSIDSGGNEVSGATVTITDDVGPCPNVASCIIPLFPVAIPNRPYTINPQVKLAAWANPPYSDSGSGTPEMRVTITPPAGGGAAKVYTIGYVTDGKTLGTILTSKNIDYTPSASGVYSVKWGISALGLSCSTTFISGDQPYFQVYGGDIIAGISLGGVPLSIPPTTADIISWNQDTGSYAGAGSQLAAIAAGDITNFVTAVNGGGSSQPSRLAFANTTKIGTKYGGGFVPLPASDSYIATVDNPTLSATHNPTPITIDASFADGVHKYTGNVTINSSVISGGKNITIFTDGTVYIAGDISYNYGTLDNIPRLNIYTTGNIIVDNDVQKLHGVFVAEGSGSTFYSCGTAPASFIGYSSVGSGSNYTICNKQLTIYGSVVAQKLVLARTYGSLAGTIDKPAEVFKHSPETWLGGRSGTGGGAAGSGANSFDYYVSLPPVL